MDDKTRLLVMTARVVRDLAHIVSNMDRRNLIGVDEFDALIDLVEARQSEVIEATERSEC